MGPKGEKGEPGAPSPYGVSVGVSITSSFLSWYRLCKLPSRALTLHINPSVEQKAKIKPGLPFETEFHSSDLSVARPRPQEMLPFVSPKGKGRDGEGGGEEAEIKIMVFTSHSFGLAD